MSMISFLPLHLQATSYVFLALPSRIASSAEVQIKNIKLHIVTDIKVGISSIFDFRISLVGWGAGHIYLLKKMSVIVGHKYFCGLQAHNVPQGSKLALLALLALFVFYE